MRVVKCELVDSYLFRVIPKAYDGIYFFSANLPIFPSTLGATTVVAGREVLATINDWRSAKVAATYLMAKQLLDPRIDRSITACLRRCPGMAVSKYSPRAKNFRASKRGDASNEY
jgi:hypothetical protein